LDVLRVFCTKELSNFNTEVNITTSENDRKEIGEETILDYWNNTYLFQAEAKVIRADAEEVKNGNRSQYIILDRTIFHPQGGGQPSDIGTITNSTGEIFNVSHVGKVGNIIKHYGQLKSNNTSNISELFPSHQKVHLNVDQDLRRLHARYHSGGHLLDVAVAEAGYTLNATKGHHAPQGSYVEYEGNVELAQRDEFIKKVQSAVDRIIKDKRPVHAKILDYSKLASAVGGTVPSYLPKDKPARVVTVEGSAGCPCGGTHVTNTEEIGNLSITKLQTRKNTVQIKYTLK